MIQIRKSGERGHFDHGWLKTYHTFSFSDYHDPKWMGFRTLRVINEDYVQPGQGFPTHSHRDMEIVTYVLEGALQHKDSMGNTSVIRPGEVQRMSAGTGVTHSEFNASDKEKVHLLQIWILPEKKGFAPSYEQRFFDSKGKENLLQLVASQKGEQGSVKIQQDVRIYDCSLEKGKSFSHALQSERAAWIQVIQGKVEMNQKTLMEGDGASIVKTPELHFSTHNEAKFLLFDLS